MGDLSVFRHFRRRVRLSVVLLALAVAALFAIEALFGPWDRASMAPVTLVFGIWVAAVIVLDFRFWRSAESAERLLDVGCSSEALVARGDGMHLLGDMPRDGLTRGEVVLLHRYALALADVGRFTDAALARRRMEEALTRMRHPERNLGGAVVCMLLADVSARLGDVTAARIYADAFRRGCSSVSQGHGAHERDVADVGAVVLGTAFVLYVPGTSSDPVSPGFSDRDVSALEARGLVGRRLAAEARLALACGACVRRDRDEAARLLGAASSAGDGLRVGRVAGELLAELLRDGPGPAVRTGVLARPAPVDPHPAALGADAAEALAGRACGPRHVLATFGRAFLVVVLALVAATIVLNVLVALGVVRW